MAKIYSDDQPIWEVVYCLKFNLAATYLDAYNAEGTKENLLRAAYETRNLKRWARDRIEMLLAECEQVRAGRSLSTDARSAVADSRDDLLLQTELNGIVPNVGILRTEIDHKGGDTDEGKKTSSFVSKVP